MNQNRIIRVFPRRTNATPADLLSFTTAPPSMNIEADEIHVSVAFTYDLPKAERLAKAWDKLGLPVKIGGPATGERGRQFTPGLYLKPGYVITSRGCNNRCWFCSVWRREGTLTELPITDGWNILDDNLLACSENHVRAVFDMLSRQPQKPLFTGGLEAKLLQPWHVDLLRASQAQRMYFAYDTPDDYEPLLEAGKLLRAGGITQASHRAACYVLIGYQGDTIDKAEQRLQDTVKAGFWPCAMLYKDEKGGGDSTWMRFQTDWLNPKHVGAKVRQIRKENAHARPIHAG